MLTRIIAIIVGVAAVAVLSALGSSEPSAPISDQAVNKTAGLTASPAAGTNCTNSGNGVQAGEVLADIRKLSYRGYSVQKLHKKVRAEVPAEYGKSSLVDVSYVAISRHGKVIKKLDSGIFFMLGNATEMGFFSFLNGGDKQLVVSQDVPKAGSQWVVDFDQEMNVIFDGQKFAVGREGYDLAISDLDGDQIYELIAPLCAFYGFEKGRLSTMETPLPDIVFKYDPGLREYLPANPYFKECLLKDIEEADKNLRAMTEQPSLGRLMSIVLDYVFVGEEQRGWEFLDETCKLPDKARIRSDMQDLLKAHPVYRYIYKKTANR